MREKLMPREQRYPRDISRSIAGGSTDIGAFIPRTCPLPPLLFVGRSNEYDGRHLPERLRAWCLTALPVVVAEKTSRFSRMASWRGLAVGSLNISLPVDSPEVRRSGDSAMNGWDAHGYRLGYGAASSIARSRPRQAPDHIGVSTTPRLDTIYPQRGTFQWTTSYRARRYRRDPEARYLASRSAAKGSTRVAGLLRRRVKRD